METGEKFQQLIQISLGFRKRFDEVPDGDQWRAIFEEAEKQTLLPFLFTGVDRLEDDQTAPFSVRSRFAMKTFQIVGKNGSMDARAAELSKMLADAGFRSCLLKGQGVAMLYEFPERRQCGDIDIWIEGGIEKVLPMLKSRWKVGEVVYHHADVKVFEDASVEAHFRPTWMYSPFTNRRLQKYFADSAPVQFANICGKGFAVPTVEFNLVFSLVHIYRHLFYEGIGLRQLVDYCHILMHSTAQDREAAYRMLSSLGMKKFCAAVMWIMQEYLGLDACGASAPRLLCGPDAKAGSEVLQSVLSGGNFGQHEALNQRAAGEGTLGRILRKFRLQLRFLASYPQEILWSPFFKTWQFLWRSVKGYK